MSAAAVLANPLDLTDLFVLRRVADDQLVNLTGLGRGAGWAGNISVAPGTEPVIEQAIASNEIVRHCGATTRIFGPYWSDCAAVVAMGDFVFVLGGASVRDQDDDTLIDAVGDVAWSVSEVPSSKRLADELELTQAALAVATLPTDSVESFLEELADTARIALACEFGAVVRQHPEPRLTLGRTSWRPDASHDLVLGSLLQLLVMLPDDGPVVSQDLRSDPSAASPLGFSEGLVSRCVVPFEAPGGRAALVVAHTHESPRGFTSLCQMVAATIGEQATQSMANRRSTGTETDKRDG